MAENDPAGGADASPRPATQPIGQDARDIAAVTMATAPAHAAAPVTVMGRDGDLRALDGLFTRTSTVIITESAAAAGRGGMGLSALARAYAETRRTVWPEPPAVVSLARPDLAGLELAAVGLRLGLATAGPLAQRVAATLAALRGDRGRLLILDDCPDARAFHAVRPEGAWPATLVTAGAAPWAHRAGAAAYPLGGLHFRDAAALVASRRPDLDPDMPEVARVAAALDEVPPRQVEARARTSVAAKTRARVLVAFVMTRSKLYCEEWRSADEKGAVVRRQRRILSSGGAGPGCGGTAPGRTRSLAEWEAGRSGT